MSNKNIYSGLLKRETTVTYGTNPLRTRTKEAQTDPFWDLDTSHPGLIMRRRQSPQEMSMELEMGFVRNLPNMPTTKGGVPYMVSSFPSVYIGSEVKQPVLGSRKTGGKIKKTGLYMVHKNEVVIPASRVEAVDKALKRAGKKALKK